MKRFKKEHKDGCQIGDGAVCSCHCHLPYDHPGRLESSTLITREELVTLLKGHTRDLGKLEVALASREGSNAPHNIRRAALHLARSVSEVKAAAKIMEEVQ